jgi:ATP-binding protein involved in chromosome partitioning
MSEDHSVADFRNGMIKRRLGKVKRLLLVLSGKGGVGKSVVSAALAAMLAESGFHVGLMDADIYGPSSALLFNTNTLPGEGDTGLTPPISEGVKIMSVDLFVSGRPVPLTGSGAKQVLLELLALTDWGELDCLVVDMPPATGDIMMSLTSLGKSGVAAVVVTMPDKLSTTVAHRVLQLLKSGRVQIVGVIGNMLRPPSIGHDANRAGPKKLAKEFGVPLLGLLSFDTGVSRAVEKSDIKSLLDTEFARELRRSMRSYIDVIGGKKGPVRKGE